MNGIDFDTPKRPVYESDSKVLYDIREILANILQVLLRNEERSR